MKIHKEGYRIIFYISLIFLLINVVSEKRLDSPFKDIVLYSSIVFFLAIAQFFKSPKRKGVEEKNAFVSPADGHIVQIEKVFEKEFFKREMLRVSIFMSVVDVHLNRIPVDGKIVYQKYHPGKYLVAFKEKSSEVNENNALAIVDKNNNEFFIRQIAGFLARRIRTYVEEGNEVKQGQELGFIRFGSRVDIYFSEDINLNVKLNQKVFGNQTIIAYL
ncbi:MAG: phosphatidylserine decarboxylase family protein [Bacteroidota bacterium]|nr:phosphatidylserine decarboxylase family protein [Bacteroidota bacterium]